MFTRPAMPANSYSRNQVIPGASKDARMPQLSFDHHADATLLEFRSPKIWTVEIRDLLLLDDELAELSANDHDQAEQRASLC